MVDNSTSISETNNHPFAQIIDHEKDHVILRWKHRYWLGTDTKI